jgi:hypothetical protein
MPLAMFFSLSFIFFPASCVYEIFASYLSSIIYTLRYQFAVCRGTHVYDTIITYSLVVEFQFFLDGWTNRQNVYMRSVSSKTVSVPDCDK